MFKLLNYLRICWKAVGKRNGQKLSYFKNFGASWGMLQDGDAVSFLDNHDNQRGHGGGCAIVTFFESRNYKIANAYMLAWPCKLYLKI